MKTNKMLWMGLLSTMMLGSCADNDENSQWTDPNQVQFTASIQGLVTKATDDAWEEGDQIGIFMKDAAAEWSAAGTQNVAYTTDAAGALSPAGTVIYYPSEDATVDFMAYYPYTAGLSGTTYNVNVATQTSQSAIDLLYADNAKGVQKADGNVVLNFSHKLAKVVFNIVPDGVTITESDLGSLTVALQNVNTTAAFDLATGTLGSAAGQANVNMLVDATAKMAEAIILPGDGPIEVAFTFNGETKTGTMDTPSFAAGSKYTYNVSLSMGDAENAVHFGNATITDWTDVPGNEIDINFDGEGGGDEPIEAIKVTDDQPFTGLDDNGQGNFTIKDVTLPSDLSYVWKWDEGSNETRSWRYMKASAYINNTNYESESWLISPALDLTEATSPVLTFSHAVNFAKGTAQTALTLWVTETATENWQQMTITNYPTSDSWTFVPSGNIDLSAYAGKTIKLGFKYTSTSSVASTWEVMDVKVAASNGGGTVEPGPTPSGTELYISEYVEKGNEKYLELYNPTDSPIDLSQYMLDLNTNGGANWSRDGGGYDNSATLSGTLAAKSVIVLKGQSATGFTGEATSCKAVNFNGNDPVGLFKNGELIDIIGVFAGGEEDFAADVTLRRKTTVTGPTTTYDENEWESIAGGTDISGLGQR